MSLLMDDGPDTAKDDGGNGRENNHDLADSHNYLGGRDLSDRLANDEKISIDHESFLDRLKRELEEALEAFVTGHANIGISDVFTCGVSPLAPVVSRGPVPGYVFVGPSDGGLQTIGMTPTEPVGGYATFDQNGSPQSAGAFAGVPGIDAFIGAGTDPATSGVKVEGGVIVGGVEISCSINLSHGIDRAADSLASRGPQTIGDFMHGMMPRDD